MTRPAPLAALALCLAALPVAAQDDASGGQGEGAVPPPSPFVIERAFDTMLASRLTAIPVVTPEGETLGDVSETILSHDGAIRALVVGVGGVLGLNEKPVAVLYEHFFVRELEEGYELVLRDVDMADLEAAPEYVPREE